MTTSRNEAINLNLPHTLHVSSRHMRALVKVPVLALQIIKQVSLKRCSLMFRTRVAKCARRRNRCSDMLVFAFSKAG